MIAASVIALSGAGFKDSAPDSPQARTPSRATGAEHCFHDRRGLVYYRVVVSYWRQKMGAYSSRAETAPRTPCPRIHVLAKRWKAKAIAHREAYERYLERRTLTDHGWWRKDVREVQRVYPETEGWLMSCASSEGGWGRFVQNSQGADVWGWLQFAPGTFSGFVRHAISDARSRGFRVPESAWDLDSTLGQALAGGWGITHGMRHHWAGAGC